MKILDQIKSMIKFQKLAISHFPSYAFVLGILTIFLSVSPFIIVIFPRFLLDEVFGERSINNIVFYLVLMGATIILSGIINALFTNKLHFISMKLKSKLRMDMALKTTLVKYELLENKEILDMKQNAAKFLEEDVDKAIYLTPQILSSFVASIGLIYIISSLNIIITIALLMVIFFNAFLQEKTEKYAYDYRVEMGPTERKISYFIMTMPDYKYGKDIRLYGLSDWLYSKYSSQLNESFKGYKNVFSKRSKNGVLISMASAMQTICVYSWLIYRAFLGYLTVGQFTMFFTAISNFSNNIINVFTGFVQISVIKKGMDDYTKFMDIQIEIEEKLETNIIEKYRGLLQELPIIEFKNVWFKYPKQETFALKDVSLKIPYGQKICVVGENGAGKSTFVNLLTRLYKPTKGEILINGLNIEKINVNTYRKFFSVVFQDFCMFAFTIKENIALSSSDMVDTESKVMDAIVLAGLDTKLESLSSSVHTHIGRTFDENGIQLSGGEFQKMALARAIYHNSPILILDEPTASLDPRAEYEIYKNFYDISKEKTTIFISHRLASSRICDRIIVFNGGAIVEEGDHETLIKNQNLYSELYNMQKQYYHDEMIDSV